MEIGSVYNPKRDKEQTTPFRRQSARRRKTLRAQPKKQTKWQLEAGKENFNANIPSGSRRVLLNRMRSCMQTFRWNLKEEQFESGRDLQTGTSCPI